MVAEVATVDTVNTDMAVTPTIMATDTRRTTDMAVWRQDFCRFVLPQLKI